MLFLEFRETYGQGWHIVITGVMCCITWDYSIYKYLSSSLDIVQKVLKAESKETAVVMHFGGIFRKLVKNSTLPREYDFLPNSI